VARLGKTQRREHKELQKRQGCEGHTAERKDIEFGTTSESHEEEGIEA